MSLQNMKFEIINADCLEAMKDIPDGSIDLTVTSPPYDNLRTYNGYSFDFEGIARELFRVTKQGGVVVWVVGDATINGSETGTSFRQALYFKDVCGFNLHDTMIYQTSKPPMNDNRYQQCFEYMFVLAKGRPKVFSALVVNSKTAGRQSTGGFFWEPNGTRKSRWQDEPINSTTVLENVWRIIERGKHQSDHPATFPEQLAYDHIISWSNEGDTILDPMCGSGTTGKMAVISKRNFIGIDISAEYCEIARARISRASGVYAEIPKRLTPERDYPLFAVNE